MSKFIDSTRDWLSGLYWQFRDEMSLLEQLRWVAAVLMVVAIVVALWARLLPGPRAIRVGNVVARAVSVGFANTRPMRGCVVGVGLRWMPDLVWECSNQRSRVHLVEVEGLVPETPYRFAIVYFGGISFSKVPRVTTPPVYHGNLRTPLPAYGTIVDEAGQRVPRALVYVYTQTSRSVAQHPVTAMTNEQGNFAVDLANLNPFGYSYVLRITTDDGRGSLSESDVRVTSPFPTVQVPGIGGSVRELSWFEQLRRRLP